MMTCSVDKPGLSLAAASGVMARQFDAARHPTGGMDDRSWGAQVGVATRPLQSTVLPHSRHAGEAADPTFHLLMMRLAAYHIYANNNTCCIRCTRHCG